jgi:hypothetical protein
MGITLAAFLGLSAPAPAEAAGFDPPAVEDLWSAVWDWLAGLWEEPETGEERPNTCQGDQGACVDPNGG